MSSCNFRKGYLSSLNCLCFNTGEKELALITSSLHLAAYYKTHYPRLQLSVSANLRPLFYSHECPKLTFLIRWLPLHILSDSELAIQLVEGNLHERSYYVHLQSSLQFALFSPLFNLSPAILSKHILKDINANVTCL